jgi:hypothetical protein
MQTYRRGVCELTSGIGAFVSESHLPREWIMVGWNIPVFINDERFFHFAFSKTVADQTTDLKGMLDLSEKWPDRSALAWDDDFYLHCCDLKCLQFHKHFINFVLTYVGPCFCCGQRCWNRLLLSTSSSFLEGHSATRRPVRRSSCTQIFPVARA